MATDPVHTFLLEELEHAKERHREAKERYWEAAGRPRQLPRLRTRLPDPENNAIRCALAEETEARNAHLNALVRLNRYLVEGTVPEDLDEMRSVPKTMNARNGS